MASAVRQLRRAQIISAARAVVARDGLDALTFKALEGELDFTRGVITYHFKNKDAIVSAVLESALDEIDTATLAAVQAEGAPADQLAAAIRATIAGFIENIEAGKILLAFWARIHSDPSVRARNARLYATYRGRSSVLLQEGIDQGVFRPVDVPQTATLIVGVIIGVVTQEYFDAGHIEWRTASEAAIDTVIRGLVQPG